MSSFISYHISACDPPRLSAKADLVFCLRPRAVDSGSLRWFSVLGRAQTCAGPAAPPQSQSPALLPILARPPPCVSRECPSPTARAAGRAAAAPAYRRLAAAPWCGRGSAQGGRGRWARHARRQGRAARARRTTCQCGRDTQRITNVAHGSCRPKAIEYSRSSQTQIGELKHD